MKAPSGKAAVAADLSLASAFAAPRPSGLDGDLRLLIVEDSPEYAALVEQMLRDALGSDVEILHHDALAHARLALLAERIDCVLLDLSLPDANGLEALKLVQATGCDVPVVVLTGSDDLTLALRAVNEGAQDFVVKREADRDVLVRSIRYSIERKRAESRLAHQAMHDALTTLPNRALLLDRLEVALARARRGSSAVALLFVDLDRFKAVNDSLGHDAGDELLVEVALRLQRALRPGDTVARFGGDEFLILCEEQHEEVEAVRVAERVRAAVQTPMTLRGHEISIGASVGIAFARARRKQPSDLIREADAAMYRAKRHGTGIELFETVIRANALRELETEHQLRGAIERGELRLHYQPEVALTPGSRPFGVEALVRWEHPIRGLLMPSDFVALAEETGLIFSLGEWVLAEACQQLATWRRRGVVPEDFTVSVNLSHRQLSSSRLPAVVAGALERSQVPPECLCLEATESCVAHDARDAASMLAQLKALGVLLALDDFGTGYSSLSALSSFPVDVVKIDRSFAERVGREAAAARMFEAVLGVVRAAELQAVAEGIEAATQLDVLVRMGCESGQGFLFAPPAPADEIATWLAAQTQTPTR